MLPAINTFAQKGNTLYAGTIGDLFSSSDGGNSWQQLTRFPFPGGISGIATIGERLYIGVRRDESVYFSDDNGKSWTRMDNGLTDREMLLGLVASGTTLFAKTRDRVFYRRADFGEVLRLLAEDLQRRVSRPHALESAVHIGA